MTAFRVPSIELLQTFIAVFQCRNFSTAAEKLHLTQSAVSHRIKRLEDELDVVLFDRSPRNVNASEAGDRLYSDIHSALNSLENVFGKIRQNANHTRLEIEVEPAFGTKWLAPRLKSFLLDHPDLKLQINLSDKKLEFSGNTEIAIKWGHENSWPGFYCEPLMDLIFTPMCSRSFLNEHGQVTAENLARFPLLHDRDYSEWARLAGSFNLSALDFRKGHIIGDTALLEQAAIEGNGIALCALELTENAVQRGDLIPPLPDLKIRSDKSYYLLRHQSIKPTIIGAQFFEWLHQAAT